MANPPSDPDTGDGTGRPRWVKVFGIIVLIVILLLVILKFTTGVGMDGGEHGPVGQAPPSSVTEVQSPSG
jgi:hypothetical protein